MQAAVLAETRRGVSRRGGPLGPPSHPSESFPDSLPKWQFLLPAVRGRTVTALANTNVSIDSVARSVGPDDALYWEVDRRTAPQLALTPARACRKLKRLGLSPAGVYWVKAGFPMRRMYLPIESRGAFRWYLDTLYRAGPPGRRLLGHALRAVGATGLLGLVSPCYAVVAVRGTPRPPALCELACQPGVRADESDHVMLLAHASAEWSRVAVVPFGRGAGAPSKVIKLARNGRFNARVEHEHAVLQHLRQVLPPGLRDTIPESQLRRWNGLSVTIETAVSGTALTTRTSEASAVAADVRAVRQWLAAFHASTTDVRVPARQWLSTRLLGEMCREYEHRFGVTEEESRLFSDLRWHLDACRGTLPLSWQHGDLGPWNVYDAAGRLGVIDWEAARMGPGLADLLYFALHRSDATEFAFLGMRGEIDAYMRQLDIDPMLLPALATYTLVEQALDLARRSDAADKADDRPSTNEYSAWLKVLARHADALLPPGRQGR